MLEDAQAAVGRGRHEAEALVDDGVEDLKPREVVGSHGAGVAVLCRREESRTLKLLRASAPRVSSTL